MVTTPTIIYQKKVNKMNNELKQNLYEISIDNGISCSERYKIYRFLSLKDDEEIINIIKENISKFLNFKNFDFKNFILTNFYFRDAIKDNKDYDLFSRNKKNIDFDIKIDKQNINVFSKHSNNEISLHIKFNLAFKAKFIYSENRREKRIIEGEVFYKDIKETFEKNFFDDYVHELRKQYSNYESDKITYEIKFFIKKLDLLTFDLFCKELFLENIQNKVETERCYLELD